MKSIKGFTLVELVMVVVLLGVLSMAGYHIMTFSIQHSFYLPHQLEADLAAAEALEIMVEGDSATVRGLRFCSAVTAIAANQVNVTDQDGAALQFRLDTGTGKLYRKIGTTGAETLAPYFMPNSVIFSGGGTGGALFTYYDSADVVTADYTLVRRIQIDLIATQGSGSIDSYGGVSRQSTSVRVYNI